MSNKNIENQATTGEQMLLYASIVVIVGLCALI